MDIFLFIYNILLIILYTCPIVYSINLYLSKKKPIYLYISILFSLYIFDNVLIYMTEFFENFSRFYNLQFMSIPSIKTFIMISITLVYFAIQKKVLHKEINAIDYIVLTLFTVSLFIVPLILDGPIMVWSYYLPYQLITIYLGYVGLRHLKKNPDLFTEKHLFTMYKNILICLILFSLLIIMEDTVVIFSFDVYSNLLVKIHNRSISEDICSIIFAIYAIKYSYKDLNFLANSDIKSSENTNSSLNLDDSISLFYDFCKYYNLTNREQEIFRLLLNNQTNQEISNDLYISIGTVKTHVHNIFQKIDVSRRNQLMIKYKDFQPQEINLEI